MPCGAVEASSPHAKRDPLDQLAAECCLQAWRAWLLGGQPSSFGHQRLLEGACVSVERGGAQAQLPTGLAPAGNGGEDLAENPLRFVGLESETPGGGKRDANRRFLLILADGGFARANPITAVLRALMFRYVWVKREGAGTTTGSQVVNSKN